MKGDSEVEGSALGSSFLALQGLAPAGRVQVKGSRTVETGDSGIVLALLCKRVSFPRLLTVSKIIHNVKIALHFSQIHNRNLVDFLTKVP